MDAWITMIFPFIWILLRTTGVLITAPVFGAKYVPWMVKVTIALVLGYVLWPRVPAALIPTSLLGLLMCGASEILFGLIMGFCGTIVMAAIETAGHIADIEIGFGMANVIDPQYGQPSPILGIFKYLLILLVFLSINGHHLFIKALHESFHLVPAGAAFIPKMWTQVGFTAAASIFKTAIILSCPVWASALIVDFALGAIARTVPQMNVFVVGMPLKTLIGLATVFASIAFYGIFTEQITLSMQRLLESLLGVIGR